MRFSGISLNPPADRAAYLNELVRLLPEAFKPAKPIAVCVDIGDAKSICYPSGQSHDFSKPPAYCAQLAADVHFYITLQPQAEQMYWGEQDAQFIDLVIRLLQQAMEAFRLRAQLALYQKIYHHSYEGMLITDADNNIVEVNPAFTRITGYKPNEVLGKNPRILSSGRHSEGFYQQFWDTLKTQSFWRGEVWNRRKTGEVYAEILSVVSIHDLDGAVSHYVGVFTDISQLKEHEAQLEHLANYDVLTGLPNRRLLNLKLEEYIQQAMSDQLCLTVVYLDIDAFKQINDQHGEVAGDKLLCAITRRLQSRLEPEDMLVRIGGDEFVMLLQSGAEQSRHEHINQRLQSMMEALHEPFSIHHTPITLTASFGVTVYPDDRADADQLLRHADQAMYKAKQAGSGQIRWFDLDWDRQARKDFARLRALKTALAEQQFVLYYQPKLDVTSGKIFGAEALLRWNHPERGILAPGMFIGHVFDSELELPLGWWVIEEALKQIERWQQQGLQLAVSVNVSGFQLLSDGFVPRLAELLSAYPDVAPDQLEIEVLESGTLLNVEKAQKVILETRELGVQFSLDDFGTGYSSLSYLRRLPVDVLKIDQSFVLNMLEDPADFGIVESVISLGRSFNRQVIAEGVETLEHASILQDMGCDLVQGFGIARPMPADRFYTWVSQWQTNSHWQGLDPKITYSQDLPLKIAAMSHRIWANRVVRYVEGEESEAPELDPRFCPFGEWYHGIGAGRFGQLDSYQRLGDLHERIHAKAVKVVHLVDHGEPAKARRKLTKFMALRDQLLACIDDLITDAYFADPAPTEESSHVD